MIIRFSPKRSFKNRVLTSNGMPEISLKVEEPLDFLGDLRFTLNDAARVEVFLFAQPHGQTLQRLLVVQFESYLPDNSYRYQYDPMETITLGSSEYMTDGGALKFDRVLRRRPEGDIAHWLYWLKNKGYNHEHFNDMLYQRFVRVLDKSARSEILILYFENLERYELKADDLLKGGVGAHRLPELRAQLMKHFHESVSFLEG